MQQMQQMQHMQQYHMKGNTDFIDSSDEEDYMRAMARRSHNSHINNKNHNNHSNNSNNSNNSNFGGFEDGFLVNYEPNSHGFSGYKGSSSSASSKKSSKDQRNRNNRWGTLNNISNMSNVDDFFDDVYDYSNTSEGYGRNANNSRNQNNSDETHELKRKLEFLQRELTKKKVAPPAPPKATMTINKYIPEVTSSLIKTDKKPLEYLYLAKNIEKRLRSYLKTFKEGKAQYEKYGFPYRGGLLLSGVPGCGKSTAILAVATYLNKDIYYIDLGLIKTNTELKMLMDHIKSSSKNGGIIIFEDIDCMSNIVLQRYDKDGNAIVPNTSLTKLTENYPVATSASAITTYDNSSQSSSGGSVPSTSGLSVSDSGTSSSSKSAAGISVASSVATSVASSSTAAGSLNSANDELSLSFLLNILDGTMAPENVIFIFTTNFAEKLDKALIRPGRIDLNIVLEKCDRYQLARIYQDLYERVLAPEWVEKFPEHTFITAEVILHLFYNKFNTDISVEELLKPFLTPAEPSTPTLAPTPAPTIMAT